MTKTFTCDQCGGVFESEWTDEEARAEQHENFGDMPDSVMAQVCDDCYEELMAACHPGFVSDAAEKS